ncbi:MAG: heavy-metal-associated domain-containing protein [Muribaculaceae bacterium]|nr:heavy-metal-associated domain-containing protein [Muribaculaceae bacterium]
MKKFTLFALLAMFCLNLYAKDMKELVVTTNPPMSCQNCENKIKGNLRFEKGVKKIETNIPDQRVTIEYDAEKTNPEKIEAAFEKIGYRVEVVNSETCPTEEGQETNAEKCSAGCCAGE